jgi:monoamine oxidase
VIRDTSIPVDSQYSLTLFIGGAPGLAWSKLPQHERRAQALTQVANIFGVEHEADVYKPIEIFEQEWSKEQWSKGAPCPATTPGLLAAAGNALTEPVGNIHFVGTETSAVWSGYMEGAVRSGVRGAKEVVEKLFEGRVVSKL